MIANAKNISDRSTKSKYADIDGIIGYINSFEKPDDIYNNLTISIGIIKILDSDITRLIFDLLIASTHISYFKELPNAKENIITLLKMKAVYVENGVVYLNKVFRRSLLKSFGQGIKDDRFKEIFAENIAVLPENIDKLKNIADKIKSPTDKLKNIANKLKLCVFYESNQKFQGFLESIVIKPDRSTNNILIYAKLIDSANEITNKGFEFLLKSRKNQMWLILIRSIKYFSKSYDEELNMFISLMEIVNKRGVSIYKSNKWTEWYSFLEYIGIFLKINDMLKNTNDMLENSKEILNADDIEEFKGLVEILQEDNTSYCFWINNSFLFDKDDNLDMVSGKYIILETNYKIYAYTEKLYEKSILNLFSKLVCNFPNLVKGQLDEESMCMAFSRGITGTQILSYLNEYCEYVPPSVANQILIWEAKQHRITTKDGVLYCDFLHLSDFYKLSKFLERKNAVLLKDEVKRVIIGSEDSYEEAKQFLKEL